METINGWSDEDKALASGVLGKKALDHMISSSATPQSSLSAVSTDESLHNKLSALIETSNPTKISWNYAIFWQLMTNKSGESVLAWGDGCCCQQSPEEKERELTRILKIRVEQDYRQRMRKQVLQNLHIAFDGILDVVKDFLFYIYFGSDICRPQDVCEYASVSEKLNIFAVMFLRRITSKLKPQPMSRFFGGGSNRDISKAIAELNQELESVFGEPPAPSFSGSVDNQPPMAQESQNVTDDTTQIEPSSFLTHVGSKGEAQMIDVSPKEITNRVAVASCKVILGQKVFDLVLADQMKKGDVLGVAKIAGICGAKQTSNLIPLCHNINLSHVRVDLTLNRHDHSVEIEGEVSCSGKTGVEMEALTAVSAAGLTVYDMCKAASKEIVITDVKLESKCGGKSGDWSRKT